MGSLGCGVKSSGFNGNSMSRQLPRVVIIGGGFGGLTAAQSLATAPVRVTLVDRRNHHLFQPLLYQVATAGLNPSDIASPIRRILRHQRNTEVLLAEATGIDLAQNHVLLDDGPLGYDYLIVATGARHSYFHHPEWESLAPGLKSLGDALEIRRRVLSAFEMAEREPDSDVQRAWLTFVVIGAGPTGVELTGTLCEIARHTLARDFRRIDPTQARVILVEASDRVLPTYATELSAKAQRQLEHLGAEIRIGQRVTDITADGPIVEGTLIPARTALWAAGVQACRLGRSLDAPHDRAGRVLVEPDLTVPGYDNAYVIGDAATLTEDGKPIPGVAPAAMQQGRHTAKNIVRAVRGEPRLPFHYRDKGSLATIGRWSAIAQFGSWKLSGPLAWLGWLFIHILFLIGFRNRIMVLMHWAWAFITYDRGARLITGPLKWKSKSTPDDSAPHNPIKSPDSHALD